MSYTHLVTNHSCSAGSSLQLQVTVRGRTRVYTLFTRIPACTDRFLRVFDRLRFLQVPCVAVCLSSRDSATFPRRTACDVSKPDRRMINCNPSAHKYMATTHELPVSRMTSRVTSRPDLWNSTVVRFNCVASAFVSNLTVICTEYQQHSGTVRTAPA
jgi:hypothetical protein